MRCCASQDETTKVIQSVTTKLPKIQEKGRSTDVDSSKEEGALPKYFTQDKDVNEILKRKILAQQEQMKAMAAELEAFKKAQHTSEKKNMEESTQHVEGTMENSIQEV